MSDFSEYMNPPESDYIKREDAQKITAEWLSGYITEQKEKLTADVVEVVRCKDCKKQNVSVGYQKDCCPLFEWRGISYGHEHDFQFCSYGERKNE